MPRLFAQSYFGRFFAVSRPFRGKEYAGKEGFARRRKGGNHESHELHESKAMLIRAYSCYSWFVIFLSADFSVEGQGENTGRPACLS
jgi:hypothetical protein